MEQEIQQQWRTLKYDSDLAALHEMIEKTERILETRGSSSELHRVMIGVFSRAKEALLKGLPFSDELDLARIRSYEQHNWDVNTVTQAQVIIQLIREDYEQIQDRISRSTPLKIPVVLVVMTHDEALRLSSGEACRYAPRELSEDHTIINRQLLQFNIHEEQDDWAQSYGQKTTDWQPFRPAGDDTKISTLIENLFCDFDDYSRSLAPEFINIQFASDPAQRATLKDLRKNGCLVVVDSISMRHPSLQQAFQISSLDVSPNTSLVTIAKDDELLKVITRMKVVIELRISDIEANKMRTDPDFYSAHKNVRCADVDTQKIELSGWLRNRVETMQRIKSIDKDSLDKTFFRA